MCIKLERNSRIYLVSSSWRLNMSFPYRALTRSQPRHEYTLAVSVNDSCLRSDSPTTATSSGLWCPAHSYSQGESYPEHGKLHDFLLKLARRRRNKQEKDQSLNDLTFISHSTNSLISVQSDQIATTENHRPRQRKSKGRRKQNDKNRTGRRSTDIVNSEGEELRRIISMDNILVDKS